MSVASRIYAALKTRLGAINGVAPYVNDATGRVFACFPSYDVLQEGVSAPNSCAIFIFRRPLSEQRSGRPQDPTISVTIVYHIVAVVPSGATAGEALELLLADIERAIEHKDDLYLRIDAKTNLLSQELVLVGADFTLPEDAFQFESLAIGVQCTFPHVYGDPDNVV
jgi:hypothetical protein